MPSRRNLIVGAVAAAALKPRSASAAAPRLPLRRILTLGRAAMAVG